MRSNGLEVCFKIFSGTAHFDLFKDSGSTDLKTTHSILQFILKQKQFYRKFDCCVIKHRTGKWENNRAQILYDEIKTISRWKF